jgi:cytochrome c biogenesis protein CcdA
MEYLILFMVFVIVFAGFVIVTKIVPERERFSTVVMLVAIIFFSMSIGSIVTSESKKEYETMKMELKRNNTHLKGE